MKKQFQKLVSVCLAVLLVCGLLGCVSTDNNDTTTKAEEKPMIPTLRHMTYNIAGSTGLDRIPNFDTIPQKQVNMKAIIQEINPDTFGVQEAPKAWIEGLVTLLDGEYACAGGTCDQRTGDRFWLNPVYYKTALFNCLDSGVLYLEEGYRYETTTRCCSYALLEQKSDGKLLLVISTHLEHRALGSEDLLSYNYTTYNERNADRNYLRDEHVKYIAQIVDEKVGEYKSQYNKNCSVIVSGDFNINYWEDDDFTHEYTRLTETIGSLKNIPGIQDSAAVAKNVTPNQTTKIWSTFREYFTDSCPLARIDYIFVSPDLEVAEYTVYNTTYSTSESSDHHPSYIDYAISS